MTSPRWYLLALLFIMVVRGWVDGMFPSSQSGSLGNNVLFMAVVYMLIYSWCCADAEARRFPLVTQQAHWVALFGIVGVPVYIFRTMPLGLAWKTFVAAVGFFILQLLLYLTTLILVRVLV